MTASHGEEGLSTSKLQQSQTARAEDPQNSSRALRFTSQTGILNIIEEKGLRQGPRTLAVPKQKYLGLAVDTGLSGSGKH